MSTKQVDRCELIIDSQLMTLISRDKLIKKKKQKKKGVFFVWGGGVAFMCANMEALILNKV